LILEVLQLLFGALFFGLLSCGGRLSQLSLLSQALIHGFLLMLLGGPLVPLLGNQDGVGLTLLGFHTSSLNGAE